MTDIEKAEVLAHIDKLVEEGVSMVLKGEAALETIGTNLIIDMSMKAVDQGKNVDTAVELATLITCKMKLRVDQEQRKASKEGEKPDDKNQAG